MFIYWGIFIKVNDSMEATQFANKIVLLFNKCKIIEVEQYWKDKSLYEILIKQDVRYCSNKTIIFYIYKNSSLLSKSWNLSFINMNNIEMSGVATKDFLFNIITWCSFDI